MMTSATLKVSQSAVTGSGFLPIVFIHGWASNSQVWDLILPELQTQFQTICIDLPGFGLNADVCVGGLNDLLLAIEAVLPQRSHIVGWSLGGMIATELSARNPKRFASLSTIASNAKFVSAVDWPEACSIEIFDNFVQSFKLAPTRTVKKFLQLQIQGEAESQHCRDFFKSRLDSDLSEGCAQHRQWLQALIYLNELDHRNFLQETKLPRLAVLGEHDSLVPSTVAQAFKENDYFQQVEVISGTAHAPHVGASRLCAEIMRKFIVATEAVPFSKNKRRIARSFSKASKDYDRAAVLQRRVAARLVSLKNDIEGQVCDIGCGTGFCAESIQSESCKLIGLDIAPGMLEICREKKLYAENRLLCADFDRISLASGVLDGAVSSMSLQWSPNLNKSFTEVHRVLKENQGAWFLFSSLGPKTLYELNDSWRSVDDYVHVNRFETFARVSQILSESGFNVMYQQREFEQLQYDSVVDLMRDLKSVGAHNVNAGIKSGLTTAHQLRTVNESYEKYRRQGKLPATYEVFYFLAIKQ